MEGSSEDNSKKIIPKGRRPANSLISPAEWLRIRAEEIDQNIYDEREQAKKTGQPLFTPSRPGVDVLKELDNADNKPDDAPEDPEIVALREALLNAPSKKTKEDTGKE